MILSFQPGDDFESIVDGLEAVTLTALDGTTTSIASALRRAAVVGEARAVGRRITQPGVTQSDVVWHLPDAALNAKPELGATITDSDGAVWTILRLEKQSLGNRWRCSTREVSIAMNLNTLVDIDIAIPRKDVHGGTQILWKRWKTSLRAKIQPIESEPDTENDVRRSRSTHRVFFQDDLPLGPEHRLVDRDGRIYQVLTITERQSISELMQVFVEEAAAL